MRVSISGEQPIGFVRDQAGCNIKKAARIEPSVAALALARGITQTIRQGKPEMLKVLGTAIIKPKSCGGSGVFQQELLAYGTPLFENRA